MEEAKGEAKKEAKKEQEQEQGVQHRDAVALAEAVDGDDGIPPFRVPSLRVLTICRGNCRGPQSAAHHLIPRGWTAPDTTQQPGVRSERGEPAVEKAEGSAQLNMIS